MMRDIEHAAVDVAADMVLAFHVRKEKNWSPDHIFDNKMEYWIYDLDELYLMAQLLFPIMLVRFVAGLPLLENE
jgi:hypothetical protein